MKIAFDAKRFFQNSSGLGNYSRDLVRILATEFPENEYVLLNASKTDRGSEILDLDSVQFLELPESTFARQLKAGKLAQNAGAEVFHGLSGELPMRWNPQPIKKIVSIHDLIFMRFPQLYSFWDRKIHFYKFKKAAEEADLVIAISEQTKKDIMHFLKVPEQKIRVVYQGCHQAFKDEFNSETAQDVRKKYALPKKFILNVGSIEVRKDLLSIVKAVHGTEIPLVVVGKKTSYFKKIQQYITKNKLEGQIFFLENVSMKELATIYKMADVFVYPSFFEGFGIPVIEALYSKTAVITSNSSALPEAGGKSALYVQPGNSADLRSKILFLWKNEAERERRSENGWEYAQKFNDQNIARDLMEVYKEVLMVQP